MGLTVLCKIAGTREGGILELEVERQDRDVAKVWIADQLRKSSTGRPRTFELSLKQWRPSRSADQNRLYWALVRILAYEAYREFGYEEVIHEELLRMYSPREKGKLSGAEVPKRSKHLDKSEFSRLVEGVFRELAMLGVEVHDGTQIGRYWSEWYNWRGAQGVDPLSSTYRSRKDWRERQVFCEACLRYLGPDSGTDAHIVSRGAGGSDEVWNLMRLCDSCHMTVQHQKGWGEFLGRFPHLEWRWKKAHDKAGAPVVEEPRREEDLTYAEVVSGEAEMGEVVSKDHDGEKVSSEGQYERPGDDELEIF